ncbi:hypothetical protein MBLNU230_g7096t1 [Neophaeotheca triangularis]
MTRQAVELRFMNCNGAVERQLLAQENELCLDIEERYGKPFTNSSDGDVSRDGKQKQPIAKLHYHLPSMKLEPLVEGVCIESPLSTGLPNHSTLNRIPLPASAGLEHHYIHLRVGDTINFSRNGFKVQLALDCSEVVLEHAATTADYVASSVPKASDAGDAGGSDTEDEDEDDLDKVSSTSMPRATAALETPATSVITGTNAEETFRARSPTADSHQPFSTAPSAPARDGVFSSAPQPSAESPSKKRDESPGTKFMRVGGKQPQSTHVVDASPPFDASRGPDEVPASANKNDQNSFPHRASGRLNPHGPSTSKPSTVIAESPQKKARRGKTATYGRKNNRTVLPENESEDPEDEEAEHEDDEREESEDEESEDEEPDGIAIAIARDGSVQREPSSSFNVPTSEAYDDAQVAGAAASRSLKRKQDPYGLPVEESPKPKKRKSNPRREPSEELGSAGDIPQPKAAPVLSAAEEDEDAEEDEEEVASSPPRKAVNTAADSAPVKKRAGALSKPSSNSRRGLKPVGVVSVSSGDEITIRPRKKALLSPQVKIPPRTNKRSTSKASTVPPPSTAESTVATTHKPSSLLLSGCSLDKKTVAWLDTKGVQVVEDVPSKRTHFICIVAHGDLKATAKVLRTLVSGRPVVTEGWLVDSKAEGAFLDPAGYVHEALTDTQELDRSQLFKGTELFFTEMAKEAYGFSGWKSIEALGKSAGAKSVDHGKAAKGVTPRGAKRGASNIIFIGLADDPDAATLRDEHDRTVYHKDLLRQSIMRGAVDLDSAEFKLELATATAKKGRKTSVKAK